MSAAFSPSLKGLKMGEVPFGKALSESHFTKSGGGELAVNHKLPLSLPAFIRKFTITGFEGLTVFQGSAVLCSAQLFWGNRKRGAIRHQVLVNG